MYITQSSLERNGWYFCMWFTSFKKLPSWAFILFFNKPGYNLHIVKCTDHKTGLTVSSSSGSAVLCHILEVPLRSALVQLQAILPLDLLCTGPFKTLACPPGFPGVRPPLLPLTWDLAVPDPLHPAQPSQEKAALPSILPTSMGLGASSFPTHLSSLLSPSSEVSFFKAMPLFFSKPQPLCHSPSLIEDFWPTHRPPLLPYVRHLSQRLRICKDELFN